MELIRLLINGISYSQTQNGAYALILSELDGERKRILQLMMLLQKILEIK